VQTAYSLEASRSLHWKLEDKSMPGLKPKHHQNLPAEAPTKVNFVNNFVKYWILLNCIVFLT
jgi:hypothetical protein